MASPPSDASEVSEDLRSLLSALATAPNWPIEELLRIAPGDRIGRYVLEAIIGRGGFGVVFAARDEELGRRVAVKVTRGEPTREVLERFQREARLAASLNHPNLVTLHDSGTVAGLPYLVLELLHGETLLARLARGPLALREGLAITADVLRALVQVHATGIVHSDLKPSNVFLTSDGRVKVLDFGLAQLRGGDTDALRAGTPGYMAPEQWRGEPTDARTDVFGVGVILYEMVTGRVPFENRASIEDDRTAPPLRGPLRSVVARALEKNLGRRHPTAAEMLAAIEAIAGRRRGRRIAVGLAMTAVAAAAVIVIGGQVRVRRATVESARLAERAGREAESIEADLRFARLQPIHDIRPDVAGARLRVLALAKEVESADGADAAEVAVARAERAIGDLAAARARLGKVLDHGERTPATLGTLGAVMLDQYERELAETATDPELDHRASTIAALNSSLRDPALRYLHESTDATPYTLARVALYENRYDDARRLAESALAASHGLYEAAKVIAISYLQEATAADDRDDFATARERANRAGIALAQATTIARSDPALFVVDCRRWDLATRAETGIRHDGAAAYHEADLACGRALVADPDDLPAIREAALVREHRARALGATGGEPWQLLDEALALLGRASAAHPTNAEIPRLVGLVLITRSNLESERDIDPRATYDAAEVALRTAWKNHPGGDAPDQLAGVEALRAEFALEHATDPTPAVTRSLALVRHRDAPRLVVIGRALTAQGSWELAHGMDPRTSLDAAIAAFEEARKKRPKWSAAVDEEGGAWQAKATWERQNGVDAAPSLDRAIESSEMVLQLDPHDLVGHANLGDVLVARAEAELVRGGDAWPFLRRAIEHLEQAHSLDPESAAPLDNLGAAHELEARLLVASGRDPATAVRLARDALARARTLARDDLVVLPTICELERDVAAWERSAGRSPAAAFTRARTACDGALALDPKNAMLAERATSLSRDIASWKRLAH